MTQAYNIFLSSINFESLTSKVFLQFLNFSFIKFFSNNSQTSVPKQFPKIADLELTWQRFLKWKKTKNRPLSNVNCNN